MRKSLAVFGEGPTEWFYLDALRIAGRFPFKTKTEQYLRKNQLLTMLSQKGSLENAISRARLSVQYHKDGEPGAYTQMFKLFDKLKEFSKEK